ncbi:trichome birefringence-like [Olea europaea subsp. europaea]|uniref:Trichome birefringence-like n=1 Tax=Olea europaea subsp. europaea TaxID=158383 RepID=A0A8S0PKD1_OLEEU|nr:trichome birefringence-like [Olea europaea subsp. europaea]
MADVTKYAPVNGRTLISDFKSHFSLQKTKRTVAYGFVFVFIGFTIFLAFAPSSNSSSPWFTNIFTSTTTSKSSILSDDSYRSHFSSIFSYFFPNSSTQVHNPENRSKNTNLQPPNLNREPEVVKNQTQNQETNDKVEVLEKNNTTVLPKEPPAKQIVNTTSPSKSSSELNKGSSILKNQTQSKQLNGKTEELKANQSSIGVAKSPVAANQTANSSKIFGSGVKNVTGNGDTRINENGVAKNLTSSTKKKKSNATNSTVSSKQGSDDLIKSLMNCDMFDGHWLRDDSYPLYKPGSCSLIDEQFNCIQNGRPDNGYHQLRWKPKGCTLPRLNAPNMLELLRGKRLVFVGDSLNRNMWESLVCILKNSLKDQSKVYEEFGRHHFRNEASYSFIFEDYKCTVEFFVSPFLVQEWEVTDKNRTRKETLRLDIIGRSADKYKNADFIVFNTGHWWTHDKTSKGKDYYQEGSHVYNELNVLEAFRKALTTWGRWVDANVNPMKTHVFFRGYSKSHFR